MPGSPHISCSSHTSHVAHIEQRPPSCCPSRASVLAPPQFHQFQPVVRENQTQSNQIKPQTPLSIRPVILFRFASVSINALQILVRKSVGRFSCPKSTVRRLLLSQFPMIRLLPAFLPALL